MSGFTVTNYRTTDNVLPDPSKIEAPGTTAREALYQALTDTFRAGFDTKDLTNGIVAFTGQKDNKPWLDQPAPEGSYWLASVSAFGLNARLKTSCFAGNDEPEEDVYA